MRFATSLTAAASLLSLASARIVGIAVPDTIKPGEGFNAIIEVENYIQSIYDVSIAFGVASGQGFPGSLGTVLNSYYLGPEQSNVVQNFTKWVPISADTPQGEAVISASLFSLLGAANAGTVENFDVSVTIGSYTSSSYVSSTQA